MTARSPTKRATRRAALPVLMSAALLAGCSLFGTPDRIRAGATFRGPPLALEAAGDRHVIWMTAPTPGYQLTFDRSERTAGPTRVFATIRRPDPAFVYPTVVVDQRVASDVRISQPVEVYARLIDHDASTRAAPYERVAIPPAD